MGRTTTLITTSEPLSGEDADRLVAQVENPSPSPDRDDFLRRADAEFAQTRELTINS